MKLIFEKNEDGKISVMYNDSSFRTDDYIEMVKSIKKGSTIEVSYDENFNEEERDNINSMFEKINDIKNNQGENTETNEESISDDPLPF